MKDFERERDYEREREAREDYHLDILWNQVKESSANMCNGCEYQEMESEEGIAWGVCKLLEEVCPEGGTVCPAALIIYESFLGSYCVNSCGGCGIMDLEEIDCILDIDCALLDKVTDFLKKGCEHKRTLHYTENRLAKKYRNISICIDCGFFKFREVENERDKTNGK